MRQNMAYVKCCTAKYPHRTSTQKARIHRGCQSCFTKLKAILQFSSSCPQAKKQENVAK